MDEKLIQIVAVLKLQKLIKFTYGKHSIQQNYSQLLITINTRGLSKNSAGSFHVDCRTMTGFSWLWGPGILAGASVGRDSVKQSQYWGIIMAIRAHRISIFNQISEDLRDISFNTSIGVTAPEIWYEQIWAIFDNAIIELEGKTP